MLFRSRARHHNIPDVFVSQKGKTRDEFDREITATLLQYGSDLILLIGFMRILSTEFCRKWQDRILNVHPSLLPKYAGGMDTNVHEEVLRNGDVETGCTIHFVTEEVDAGPILIQKKCAVDGEDTVEAVVVVNNLLDRQGDRGHLLGKGGHADLSVNRCVGVPAQKLRSLVDGMGNGMVVGMMLSTGKCNQGKKNEAPHVDCLKV